LDPILGAFEADNLDAAGIQIELAPLQMNQLGYA
jgi:hypothetical protein